MAYGASTRFDRESLRLKLAALMLYALISGCSGTSYSGPGWSARVIDMETGAPIEGANVAILWPLELYSGQFAGWLFVTETVTDKDGIFSLPAWGPLTTPTESGRQTRLSPNVPHIRIFKSGYEFDAEDCCSDTSYLNNAWHFGSGPPTRETWSNQRVFGIARFTGTPLQYLEYLDNNLSLAGPICGYINMPRFFATAIIENRKLVASLGRGVSQLSIEDIQSHRDFGNCPISVKAAVERYLQ